MGYYLLLAQSDIPAGRVRWKEMKERRSAHEKKADRDPHVGHRHLPPLGRQSLGGSSSGSMVCQCAWAFDGSTVWPGWCGCDNDSCCSSCLEHVVPHTSRPSACCKYALLLFCVVIADATRFARCLIWKLQQIGSEWAIYMAMGASHWLGIPGTRTSWHDKTFKPPLRPSDQWLIHSFGPLATMKISTQASTKCVCVCVN